MGRKAASITHRKRLLCAEKDARMMKAVAFYRALEALSNPPKPPERSIRSVAIEFRVDPTTLGRRLDGGVSMNEFNRTKRHLTEAEERVLLDHIIGQAHRGFPLTHGMLEERANAILQVRKGPDFTVGVSWVSRFLEIHLEELSVYWSNPLDRSRASGLNPTAVGWYYDTLEKLQREHNIPEENWYAADESRIAMGVTATVQVIGPAGQKMQHKQQDGEREIVTVMETICPPGEALRPTIVFKGKNLLHTWGLNNDCDASIGVGPNGYMDSELAVAYLKEFDEQTKHKNDLPRVLMVDGHASHCGLEFLDLAVKLNIFVVSYPPHTTHALQGLDVVVFGALKHHWQVVRDARERGSGLPVKKEDFIQLYTVARTATLTPEIIKEAFRKTGAYPINRNAVSPEQMEPSVEASIQHRFPADLSSPVKAVLAAHHTLIFPPMPSLPIDASSSSDFDNVDGNAAAAAATASNATTPIPLVPHHPSLYTPSKRARAMNILLAETSASHLISLTTALTSDDATIPAAVFEKPGDELVPDWSLLRSGRGAMGDDDQQEFILNLLTNLGRAKAYSAVLGSCLETSNAQLVLAHLEIARMRTSLHETKAQGRKKNSRAKLMSSGAARLLTSDQFRDAVRKDEEAAQEKVARKIATGKARSLTKAKKEWRAADVAQRKAAKANQDVKWMSACLAASKAGMRKPVKPKPPIRPKTPSDEFFLAADEELEEIDIAGFSGDDDDEE